MNTKPLPMMWFDNNGKKTFEQRLVEALSHYRNKHGAAVSTCEVHPVEFSLLLDAYLQENPLKGDEQPPEAVTVADIQVVGRRYILPNNMRLIPAEVV